MLRWRELFLDGFDARSRWTPREPLTRTTSPGRRFCCEPAAGGFGVGKKERRDSAGAGGGGQMLGVALNAGDQIEAGLGGGASAGGVQRGAVLAQLQHLAGDEDAAASAGRAARVRIMERSASGLEL